MRADLVRPANRVIEHITICMCVSGPETRGKNGENTFLLRVASVAKRKYDLQTNWMRPAPTRMIG